MVRAALLVSVLAALALAGAASGAGVRLASLACSTHGLSASAGTKGSAYRVVELRATGLGCSKARTIALSLARELARNGTISVSDASSYSIDQLVTCTTRCIPRTDIAISFPSGSLSVALAGAGSAGAVGSGVTPPALVPGGPGVVA